MIKAVLTDLDGTLFEPDSSLCHEALECLKSLMSASIPVCPVTSKTAVELTWLNSRYHFFEVGSFENGAGLIFSDGRLELMPDAVPLEVLKEMFLSVRTRFRHPIRSIDEIDDRELMVLTGLDKDQIVLARQRSATLPLQVDRDLESEWIQLFQKIRNVKFLRGNRFLHFQGTHTKASVVPQILNLYTRKGISIGIGDSPNDIELLSVVDIPVIISGPDGPDVTLVQRYPEAFVSDLPHGKGFAQIVSQLVTERMHGKL